jgi:zinc transport system ATP-binding protein
MHKLNFVDHTKNIIEIENISFAYLGGENILENINLKIHQGDYIGFVGPNGSGKTTLIKIILGLLRPQKGSIKIFKKDYHDFKKWHKIGYVPQNVNNFDKNFPVSVSGVVLMGRYAKKSFWQRVKKSDMELVQKVLEQVEMWEYKDRLIGDLSGGQIQRVFIARALVNNPEIIFLDEPTSGIDKKSQDSFYALLQKLNKELHITLVIVSHDIERLTHEVMHMVCINRTLTCHSTPEEFIKESQTANIFGENVKIITHHQHN